MMLETNRSQRSSIENFLYLTKPAMALISNLLCMAEVQASAIEVMHTNLDDALSTEQPMLITLNALPSAQQGELRVIVNNKDLTALVNVSEPHTLKLDMQIATIAEGVADVRLYLVNVQGQWQQLQAWAARITEPRAPLSYKHSPRLVITNDGQLDEGSSGDAFPSDPRTFQDVSLQAGLHTQLSTEHFQGSSNFNFIGASRQEETLRFGEKDGKAHKVDLSDFLLELSNEQMALQAGHMHYGNNPLLLNGFSSRGLGFSYRLSKRVDLSLSSMNATSLVGFNNIFGLNDSKHRLDAATLGVELLPTRPGELRLELTYMDASKRSTLNFDVGEVADAERSNGWGARLLGATDGGRLRADLSVASSRFSNPNDPLLSLGDELVKTGSSRDLAYRVELNYQLLQNFALTERSYASFALRYVHDKADPLYRSLGAYVPADRLNHQWHLNGQIGALNLAINHARSEDNLDDVPTILTTKTKNTGLSASLSMAQLFSSQQDNLSYWPELSYNWSENHQFAANNPDSEFSGFNGGSHLPDQVNNRHELGLNWSGNYWSFGLRGANATQDNRQVGRRAADFELMDYGVNVSLRPIDSLGIGFNWSIGTNDDKEAAVERETQAKGFNIDWIVSEHWSIVANLEFGESSDSLDLSETENTSGSAQVNWNFELPLWKRDMPGQFFLRYSRQENKSQDNVFGFESDGENWLLNSGFSLNLF